MRLSILVIAVLSATASAWKICNVVDYGAKSGTDEPQTAAIQKAMDDCGSSGGGEVLLPTGKNFTSGALWLQSNILLRIAPGAALLGSKRLDNATWPRIYTRVGGTMMFSPASLLNGARCLDLDFNASKIGDQCKKWSKLRNVTITGAPADGNGPDRPQRGAREGAGMIDGQGSGWFQHLDYRPTLLGLLWIDGLTLFDLYITQPGFWTIHPVFCNNVLADGLTVLTIGPNTDGFDPDSSSNVLLQRSVLSCGDDVVAIKSGKDADGRAVGIPTYNVTVRDCSFGLGHGLAIGSEMSGGVSLVLVDNVTMVGTERGVRVKSAQGRGGAVRDVTYRSMQLEGVGTPVSLNMFYSDPNAPGPSPVFSNISVVNLTATPALWSSSTAGEVECLPQSPCTEGIVLQDVDVKDTTSWSCKNAKVSATNVQPAPASSCFDGRLSSSALPE